MIYDPDSARSRILSKLRENSVAKYNIETKPSPPKIGDSMSPDDQEISDLVSRFESTLMQNRIEAVRAEPQGWQHSFSKIVTQVDKQYWLTGNHRYSKPLIDVLTNKACTVVRYDRKLEQIRQSLFNDIEVSVSLAEAGLVETGSLVIRSQPGEPRLLSLIAPIHVILCPTRHILANMAAYFNRLDPRDFARTSNLVVVSSPSKTADIQQKLAYGAHGPKRVIALLF